MLRADVADGLDLDALELDESLDVMGSHPTDTNESNPDRVDGRYPKQLTGRGQKDPFAGARKGRAERDSTTRQGAEPDELSPAPSAVR
jgi:hypothetical protein